MCATKRGEELIQTQMGSLGFIKTLFWGQNFYVCLSTPISPSPTSPISSVLLPTPKECKFHPETGPNLNVLPFKFTSKSQQLKTRYRFDLNPVTKTKNDFKNNFSGVRKKGLLPPKPWGELLQTQMGSTRDS